jgi:uncharacterized membrane protein YesL
VSRAESPTLPAAPRIGRVLRTSGEDLYYHGVRLVPANVAWGIGLIVTSVALSRSILGLVLVLVLLPLTIGLMGMATTLVRERTLVMGDLVRSIRTEFAARLALGLAQLALFALAVVDLLVGIQLAGLGGLVLIVTALYTLAATWVVGVVAWPIVMDPLRVGDPLRRRLRLALILVVAHPVRLGALALLLAGLLVAGTVLTAAIVTFMVAYVSLVAAHFVLPAADRMEGRTAQAED